MGAAGRHSEGSGRGGPRTGEGQQLGLGWGAGAAAPWFCAFLEKMAFLGAAECLGEIPGLPLECSRY